MAHTPKLGLALSGGGFRASLFHIGVLARLAEMNLLRSIEVISTVSGGSIIGAYYYLHLKRLLESKPDRLIEPQEYVGLIKTIEKGFLAGIQKNLRTRAYADFGRNWKMIRDRTFTRSDRMAELYDEAFYDGASPHPRMCMSELKIQPPKAPKHFYPRKHNAGRVNKVPVLILNSTTLNSGRNWQFSAVDAGEHPPVEGEDAYNKNFLLKAFRYDQRDLPDKYRKIPLGVAVASSAAVPGIFPPLPLTGLYRDVTPKLVDGGVFDNQGISALLFERCSHILVSDASGQMDNDAKPASGLLGVLARTNSVLMDRVRDEGFELLETSRKSGQIRNYVMMHMREGFSVEELNPLPKPWDRTKESVDYGINPDVQLRLSNMRTDLDSFTDVEAYSVMYSGYRIAEKMAPEKWKREFKGRKSEDRGRRSEVRGRKSEVGGAPWEFEVIQNEASSDRPSERYMKQLAVSSETLFKAYRLMPSLRILGILILIIALAVGGGVIYGAGWLISELGLAPAFVTLLVIFAGALILGLIFRKGWLKRLWEGFVVQYVFTIAIALIGTILAKLHLSWIDPAFLKYGRVR